MLQLNYLREQTAEAKNRIGKRHPKYIETIDSVLAIDEQARLAKKEMESCKADANSLAKRIGEFMQLGKKEEAELLKQETAQLKANAKVLEEKSKLLEEELFNLLVTIPNAPTNEVPEGKTPEENVTVLQFGNLPVMGDNALPHWDLITKYNLIDFELGTKITGAGFPVYRGKGARMQRGLVNFFWMKP